MLHSVCRAGIAGYACVKLRTICLKSKFLGHGFVIKNVIAAPLRFSEAMRTKRKMIKKTEN